MKKSKKIAVIIFSIIAVVSLGITVLASNMDQVKEWYVQLGQTEAQTSTYSNVANEIYMAGDTITIYTKEVQQREERYKLFEMEDAHNQAVDSLLEREAFYNKAKESGYAIEDSEVEAYITEMRTNIAKADNYEDYLTYISGTGMTEDDYWADQFDQYKKTLLIEKYIAPIREDFLSDQDGKAAQDRNALWAAERTRLAQELIEADHVEKVR